MYKGKGKVLQVVHNDIPQNYMRLKAGRLGLGYIIKQYNKRARTIGGFRSFFCILEQFKNDPERVNWQEQTPGSRTSRRDSLSFLKQTLANLFWPLSHVHLSCGVSHTP